ncbi:hypothetical protein [Corynebacterium pygosceleis]|uniref:hypothetical protein n=1 Tax=Corynebacterium pygosceleis TaxID=2800406 RepID=UPI001902E9F5|nr:hypothetical protein [Corynebacterium pygosceleis]MCK7676238.1 hypothetical protein [Corynebacterium pygosceleis]MCL0121602.1 hypothetical protein [Corynebacterium pygosceleis]
MEAIDQIEHERILGTNYTKLDNGFPTLGNFEAVFFKSYPFTLYRPTQQGPPPGTPKTNTGTPQKKRRNLDRSVRTIIRARPSLTTVNVVVEHKKHG